MLRRTEDISYSGRRGHRDPPGFCSARCRFAAYVAIERSWVGALRAFLSQARSTCRRPLAQRTARIFGFGSIPKYWFPNIPHTVTVRREIGTDRAFRESNTHVGPPGFSDQLISKVPGRATGETLRPFSNCSCAPQLLQPLSIGREKLHPIGASRALLFFPNVKEGGWPACPTGCSAQLDA